LVGWLVEKYIKIIVYMNTKENKVKNYLKITDNKIDIIKKPLYISYLVILNLCYFFIYFGIISINTLYLNYLNIFIQTFVSLFLMYRFFPFRTHYLRDFDPQIIFACGIFLFVNTFSIEVSRFYNIIEKLTDGIKNVIEQRVDGIKKFIYPNQSVNNKMVEPL